MVALSQLVNYSPTLKIVNLSALPRGTGAKFLLCIEGLNGELIAKAWKRSLPKSLKAGERLVSFH